VIDDDEIYQIIVAKIIQNKFVLDYFFLLQREDGLEALITIETRIYPGYIILDINMPVMDGWDFMEEMELLESLQIKHISVYIASSSIAVEDKNKSKKYPAILGLSKPLP
jgi:CheY-like chemotaxis protein